MTDILSLNGKDLDRELDRIIKTAPKKRQYWSEKEILVIRRLSASNVDTKTISKVVGRSIAGVEGKLKDLGLTEP